MNDTTYYFICKTCGSTSILVHNYKTAEKVAIRHAKKNKHVVSIFMKQMDVRIRTVDGAQVENEKWENVTKV